MIEMEAPRPGAARGFGGCLLGMVLALGTLLALPFIRAAWTAAPVSWFLAGVMVGVAQWLVTIGSRSSLGFRLLWGVFSLLGGTFIIMIIALTSAPSLFAAGNDMLSTALFLICALIGCVIAVVLSGVPGWLHDHPFESARSI